MQTTNIKLATATTFVLGQCYQQMASLENATGRARQIYHIPRHISVMSAGAMRLAEVLGITDAIDLAVIQCAVAAHDWYQEYDPNGMMSFDKRGVLQRKRMRGPNEERSADKFVELMTLANRIFGNPFPKEKITLGELGIRWTYPEWVQEAGTFFHPLPREYAAKNGGTVPVIPFVVFASDLLDVNVHPGRFLEFARREYVESAWGVQEALEGLTKRSIEPARVDHLNGHLLAFFGGEDGQGGQVKFRHSRAKYTCDDVGLLPPQMRDKAKAFMLSGAAECHAAVLEDLKLLRSLPSFYERAAVAGFGPIPMAA